MSEIDFDKVKYIIVIQCHIVKQRCSGYLCEYAFYNRTGGFSDYPKEKEIRYLSMTCGGCCGRAVHRKLNNFLRMSRKKEKISKDEIVVHFSSCISFESYHGNPCPFKRYMEKLVQRLGLKYVHGTRINKLTEERRKQGVYRKRLN